MGVKWKVVGLLCCACVSVCGAPAEDVNRKSALELLEDLKVTCSENPLLNSTSMSDDPMFVHCAKAPIKLKRSDLYCLSFLDVNRRLCDLRSYTAFNWTERLRTAESKEVTTDIVCDPTTGITFTDLEEYPTYKKTIDSVFHNKIACFKLCLLENEDINVSVNYFCKVLYYGTAIIESVTKDSDAVSDTHGTSLKSSKPSVENIASDMNKNDKTVESKKYLAEQPVNKDNVPTKISPSETSLIIGPKTNPNNYKQRHYTATTYQPMRQQQIKAPLSGQIQQRIDQDPIVDSKQVQELSKPAADNKEVETNEMKPPTVDEEPSKTNQEEKPQNKLTSTLLDNKLAKDQDQDQNPDDSQVLDGDSYDADDDMRMIDQGGAGVVSPRLQQEDLSKQVAETPRHGQISVDKELSAAYIPPEYNEVDDGSFVPLFFFGVFSMVLLYILYHNKNKIMGLMIEGRQDRRRNSRGHSYRRLDTLEQAMSSNPTNTPSKIIY